MLPRCWFCYFDVGVLIHVHMFIQGIIPVKTECIFGPVSLTVFFEIL